MTTPKILAGIRNGTTASVWPVLIFALIALGAGLGGMAAAGDATAGAVATLVTAVLGVVGTHAGHVAGEKLAAKQSPAQPPLPGLEQLAQLHTDGHLTDPEFTAAKKKLLG